MTESQAGPRQHHDHRLAINSTDHWPSVAKLCWSQKESDIDGRSTDRWHTNEITTRLTVLVKQEKTTPVTTH